jgi:ketosteroid isomerase-like protein
MTLPDAAAWTAPSSRAALSGRMARSSARRRPAPHDMSDVDQLLAYEQIRQLVARYALAVNLRDLDALVELFVPGVEAGHGRTGREALKESFARHMNAADVDILEVSTHVIDLVDRDHAIGTVYSRCELGDPTRWSRQAIAYEDDYERRDGAWYFVHRDHLLFYGVDEIGSPLDQQPAQWPRRTVGRGSVPYDWPTWQAYRNRRPEPAR